VAVSAYELENLPLPEPGALLERVRDMDGNDVAGFEEAVCSLYHDR
jgi:hypothetical protein